MQVIRIEQLSEPPQMQRDYSMPTYAVTMAIPTGALIVLET